MVKLKSGREVELRPLTIREKFQLRKTAVEYASSSEAMYNPEESLNLVCLATDKTDDELDKENWTVQEVDECAMLILEQSNLSEKVKKK